MNYTGEAVKASTIFHYGKRDWSDLILTVEAVVQINNGVYFVIVTDLNNNKHRTVQLPGPNAAREHQVLLPEERRRYRIAWGEHAIFFQEI